jgi:hypothetical protein
VRDAERKELRAAEIQNAARKIHYVPFTRKGKPLDAWVQDELALAAPEELPERAVPFPKISDPAKISIQLSRSGCYGPCPTYDITIRGDGKVSYRGELNVSILGAHSSHVDAAEVSTLLERFRAANFLGLRESYRAHVTDSATYRLSVNLGGHVKAVEDYVGEWVGMPAVVTELEDAVDTVSDSARWVTSSPGTLEAVRQSGIGLTSPQAARILRTAVRTGDLVTAKRLLDAGTPVDQPAPSRGSPWPEPPGISILELTAWSGEQGTQMAMLKTLLAVPALSADKGAKHRALAEAANNGCVGLANALIDAGADPSARFIRSYDDRDRSETYLMLAASSGVWAMLDDALARPHDIHAVDEDGSTALVYIVTAAPPMEDVFPLVDRLLAAGADRSELDRTLLDTCNPNWIPGLVARGGNINARDAKGNTPLFQSCTPEGVQALLDAGADPTLRNAAGKTAIEATYPPQNGEEDSRAAVIRRFLAQHPAPKHN